MGLINNMDKSFIQQGIHIEQGDALRLYKSWPAPMTIISDGPYGLGGYKGDLRDPNLLPNFYEAHIREWSRASTPQTTLWFWNTEVGWAMVHPLLEKLGWEYRTLNIWDKGIAHVAGNTNSKTLRNFPVVTEVCAHYVKKPVFKIGKKNLSMKEWLRSEWKRTGLPLNAANKACGVSNAATRKYLTTDDLWYMPPADVFAAMVDYANKHGKESGKPFFSIDQKKPLSEAEWERMRAKFNFAHGVTNVWAHPAVRGEERRKVDGKVVHRNQKPLELIERIVRASTDKGDVIWEPFGGLATGAVVARKLGREAYTAEIDPKAFRAAVERQEEEFNQLEFLLS